MKTFPAILLVLHGVIHLVGFREALHFSGGAEPEIHASKFKETAWLAASIIFMTTAIFYLSEKSWWWMSGLIAVAISQALIIQSWNDAKWGTIVNGLIIVFIIIGYGTWSFEEKYKDVVHSAAAQWDEKHQELLTEKDIQHLPALIQKYIRYTGSLNKPKVTRFRVRFTGKIRKNEQSEWMPFTSEQNNFISPSTRLFFMKASMKHLPVTGFHSFREGHAYMDIRLLSLFRVQYQSGKEMDIAETVTFFNDMCCMAPATLIDPRVSWKEAGRNMVQASFQNNGIVIAALLFFNNDGALINFVSDDRYASEDSGMKKLRWSTPLREYKDFNGYRLAGYAETIYSYPEGDLCYGQFRSTEIVYNQ